MTEVNRIHIDGEDVILAEMRFKRRANMSSLAFRSRDFSGVSKRFFTVCWVIVLPPL